MHEQAYRFASNVLFHVWFISNKYSSTFYKYVYDRNKVADHV